MDTVLHVSAELVGFAIFFSSLTGAIFQLVGGEVCDRLGRKPVFVIGLVLLVLSFLCLGWAVSTNAPYIYHLVFLLLTRIATGLFRPMPNVIAADIVPAERRLEAFSLLRIGLNMGFALGPLVGGVMAVFSYASMFYFTAITATIYMFLVIVFIGDTRTCKPSGRLGFKDLSAIARDRPFMAFAVLTFLIGIFYSQMYTPLSIYAKGFAGLGEPEIGTMFAINGSMVVLIQYPITLLTEKYRLTTAMGIGAILYALGFTLVGFSHGMLMIGFCVFVVTMGELCFMPSSTTLTTNLSTGERRGRYIGCVLCALGFFYLKRLVPVEKDAAGYIEL